MEIYESYICIYAYIGIFNYIGFFCLTCPRNAINPYGIRDCAGTTPFSTCHKEEVMREKQIEENLLCFLLKNAILNHTG